MVTLTAVQVQSQTTDYIFIYKIFKEENNTYRYVPETDSSV